MVTVFTNGCFDLLHPGHVHLLERARSMGDRLVVGLNSDRSVRELKGTGRPILPVDARQRLVESLRCVDEVIVFDEPTPESLIGQLMPEVLVKGSDWDEREIVGADLVATAGGRVVRIDLLDGWSTSDLIARVCGESLERIDADPLAGGPHDAAVAAHIELVGQTVRQCGDAIAAAGELLIDAARRGAAVLACGNGGSAADAQHLAAELVGGSGGKHRRVAGQAAVADGAILTALANDRGYERVFADQVECLSGKGDVVIGISAGGSSTNVLAALAAGRDRGCRTIALTAAGTPIARAGDVSVAVPARDVARVQEAHHLVIHLWCDQLARECPA
jgi:D-glycero-beta-D-manno-heptose 1-phosphate adenylyltransferase